MGEEGHRGGSQRRGMRSRVRVVWLSLTGGIDDGVVPLLREELLGGARDGDSSSALLLLGVHVEGKGEGGLAEGICLSLELLELTLRDSSKLEDEASSGGGLS